MLTLSGERKPEAYLATKHFEGNSTFSPDGRWLAYQSDESGRSEIYVQGFPDPRGKWLISDGGGTNPVWRTDGKELFWVAPGNMLMAAGVELWPSGVKAGRAEPLFRVPHEGRFQSARDGRRFLVQELEDETQRQKPLVVELNWASRLGK